MGKVFVVGFLTFIALTAEAQSFYSVRRDRNLMLSAGAGTANYFGELVNPGSLGKIKPGLNVGAEYYFFPRISARAQLSFFQISGSDEFANDDRRTRNLSFRSNNIELSALGLINLFPQHKRFYQRPQFNIHAFAGIGVVYINPKALYQGEWHALRPLQTEGVAYSAFQPVIPIGLGIRYKVNPFLNILIEGGQRITFTDYLDDVSKKRYPQADLLKSDLARALSDRRPEIGTQPRIPHQQGVRGNPEKKRLVYDHLGNDSVLFSKGNFT